MLLVKIFQIKAFRTVYLAWFSIALFYFYQYILRVVPNVLQEELRQQYHINAEAFATLGSLYLLAYAGLQIPLGILVDRIGVKKVASYSIITCILGTLLFTTTQYFFIVQVSRFLIGAGSASAFMCSLKYIADHFLPGSRGFLMGATLAFGTIGTLVAAGSMHYVSTVFSWQAIITTSILIGIIVLIMILLFVKEPKEDQIAKLNRKTYAQAWVSIKNIILNKYIIIYAIAATGLYTPLASLADLWGAAFIKQKFMHNHDDASMTSMMLYVGLTFGSVFLPWLTEKNNIINQAIVFCGLALIALFSIVLLAPPLDSTTLRSLFFLMGFFGGAEMMCFTGALNYSRKMDSGEIIGVVNTFNILAGAILEQSIGDILEYRWKGGLLDNGLRYYTTSEFEVALSSMLLIIVITTMVSIALLAKPRKRFAS